MSEEKMGFTMVFKPQAIGDSTVDMGTALNKLRVFIEAQQSILLQGVLSASQDSSFYQGVIEQGYGLCEVIMGNFQVLDELAQRAAVLIPKNLLEQEENRDLKL